MTASTPTPTMRREPDGGGWGLDGELCVQRAEPAGERDRRRVDDAVRVQRGWPAVIDLEHGVARRGTPGGVLRGQ